MTKPRYMAPGMPEATFLPATTSCSVCGAKWRAYFPIDGSWDTVICAQCKTKQEDAT